MAEDAFFKFHPLKFHQIEAGPGNECWLTPEDALTYYRQMFGSRTMEQQITAMFKKNQIRGFSHTYIGEEACSAGLMAIREEGDPIITSYRCHPWALSNGATYEQILCEMTGDMRGISNGKGGSMHMYGKNFFGGHGIVGDQIALGAGLAFALKYEDKENVCFTMFGDGASNQGQFFEACDMAKLWSLPVVFVCENNGYGMYTSVKRSSASGHLYDRLNYLPGIWADGMDVLAVREALRFARDYAVSGYGPIFVELDTYNYEGYASGDQGGYRSPEEIESVRKTRDPIDTFKARILDAGLANTGDLETINAQIREQVQQAATVASECRALPKEALYTDVYKNSAPQLVRGVTADETVIQPYLYTSDIINKMA